MMISTCAGERLEIAPKEVIGPLPRGQALMILSAKGKTFPIECSIADAAACHSLLWGDPFNNPYVFLCESVDSLAAARLESLELREVDGSLYSLMFFRAKDKDKPVRKSTSFPAEGVNAALASRVPAYMSVATFDKIVDSTELLGALRRQIGRLWFMQELSSTADMRALSDYLEESMPGGCVVRK